MSLQGGSAVHDICEVNQYQRIAHDTMMLTLQVVGDCHVAQPNARWRRDVEQQRSGAIGADSSFQDFHRNSDEVACGRILRNISAKPI